MPDPSALGCAGVRLCSCPSQSPYTPEQSCSGRASVHRLLFACNILSFSCRTRRARRGRRRSGCALAASSTGERATTAVGVRCGVTARQCPRALLPHMRYACGHPQELLHMTDLPPRYRFPNGESGADVYDRMTIFEDHLVRDINAGARKKEMVGEACSPASAAVGMRARRLAGCCCSGCCDSVHSAGPHRPPSPAPASRAVWPRCHAGAGDPRPCISHLPHAVRQASAPNSWRAHAQGLPPKACRCARCLHC